MDKTVYKNWIFMYFSFIVDEIVRQITKFNIFFIKKCLYIIKKFKNLKF